MAVGRRTQSFGQFAVKLDAYAKAGQPAADLAGVKDAALLLTNAARASIRAGSGGDMAMSNVGRRGGARVGARFDIQGDNNPTALIKATGPLHLLDNPTAPHQIMSKVKKGRSQASRAAFYNAIFGGGSGFGNAKPLRTPYGPRYSVQHPGTRGKRTFFRGIDAAKPFAKQEFIAGQRRMLRRFFG